MRIYSLSALGLMMMLINSCILPAAAATPTNSTATCAPAGQAPTPAKKPISAKKAAAPRLVSPTPYKACMDAYKNDLSVGLDYRDEEPSSLIHYYESLKQDVWYFNSKYRTKKAPPGVGETVARLNARCARIVQAFKHKAEALESKEQYEELTSSEEQTLKDLTDRIEKSA